MQNYFNFLTYKSKLYNCLVGSGIEKETSSLYWINLDNLQDNHLVFKGLKAGFHLDDLFLATFLSNPNEVYINKIGKSLLFPGHWNIEELKPASQNTFYVSTTSDCLPCNYTFEIDFDGNRINKFKN